MFDISPLLHLSENGHDMRANMHISPRISPLSDDTRAHVLLKSDCKMATSLQLIGEALQLQLYSLEVRREELSCLYLPF